MGHARHLCRELPHSAHSAIPPAPVAEAPVFNGLQNRASSAFTLVMQRAASIAYAAAVGVGLGITAHVAFGVYAFMRPEPTLSMHVANNEARLRLENAGLGPMCVHGVWGPVMLPASPQYELVHVHTGTFNTPHTSAVDIAVYRRALGGDATTWTSHLVNAMVEQQAVFSVRVSPTLMAGMCALTKRTARIPVDGMPVYHAE